MDVPSKLACVQTPPLPQEKGGGDSRLPIFSEEGRRLYTGYVETSLVN